MKPLIGLLIAFLAGASLAAETTYRWLDDGGRVVYGTKPPAGRTATPVDTTPSGPVDQASPAPRAEPEKRRPDEARAQPAPAQVPIPAPRTDTPVRGMNFQTFVRLQRGMTEGELLVRAGQPDHESIENFRHDIIKTWYYFPTVADPYTTVVTVRGGRIANLDRVKRF
jgi:uncharacterized protein DUF4124